MTKLTATQINCLKAAAHNGGKLERFSRIYWKPVGYKLAPDEAYPDRIDTFGTKTVNALILAGMMIMHPEYKDGAEITDAGRDVLAKLGKRSNA